MKFLKSTFLFLVIFIFSAFLCAVMGMTGLSYYAVNELAKATAPASIEASMVSTEPDFQMQNQMQNAADPNLKSLVKIGSDYRRELSLFDQMLSEIAQKKSPEFCNVLCNPSYLDKERLKEERSQYLAEYFQEQGVRALEDPVFRMKLEEVGFISRLFPSSLRDLLGEIEGLHKNSQGSSSKLLLALKLEMAVLTEISSLSLRLDSMKGEADKFRSLRELIRSCHKGTRTHKSVRKECEAIISI